MTEHEKLIRQLKSCLKEIELLTEQFPSGVDYDADPKDQSPPDATAHTAGLIWQLCQEQKRKAKR